MKKTGLPLWITLSEVHLRLFFPVGQTEDDVQLTEGNNISETLEYEILGIGELSRTIEVKLKTTVERFNELDVSLKAHRKGNKKYSGYFIYSEEDNAFKLTLYLDVPELTFNKFCKKIASKNINNLSVGITLNEKNAVGVDVFEATNVDDIISYYNDDLMFNRNVKPFSIAANIQSSLILEMF